jgi:hypothetical protein
MSPMSQEHQKQIDHLKEKIHELQEYLISDCCRQCLSIIKIIEEHQEEIQRLQHQLET